ncbi:MAG: dienelactone hydrolase family protein [Desulfobacterales bacterium]|nr:dienelactone hydrolase family protein [Desulfobacterales bacterium]
MNEKLFSTVYLIAIIVLLQGCVSSGYDNFKGISDRPENEIELKGKLYKPEGDGPFPAVILLHRCAGIETYDYKWASRLKNLGYVAFLVDSFGPRRISNACGNSGSIGYKDRAMDAYSAKRYLSKLSFINSERIAVIGWSMGGNGVLQALDPVMKDLLPSEYSDHFKAAISFYPYCFNWLDNLTSPLLILAGGKDDWTPVDYCENRMPKIKTKHEVKLKIYQDAYHCFDCTGRDTVYQGHKLKYNSKVTADSVIQVEKFLAKYLKN